MNDKYVDLEIKINECLDKLKEMGNESEIEIKKANEMLASINFEIDDVTKETLDSLKRDRELIEKAYKRIAKDLANSRK